LSFAVACPFACHSGAQRSNLLFAHVVILSKAESPLRICPSTARPFACHSPLLAPLLVIQERSGGICFWPLYLTWAEQA